jgi:hypothetical protein
MKKMFNIPGHKGNANQNHTKIPPHVRMVTIKNTNNNNVGEVVGKKESSYTLGGTTVYNHSTITVENSMKPSQKTKNKTAI